VKVANPASKFKLVQVDKNAFAVVEESAGQKQGANSTVFLL